MLPSKNFAQFLGKLAALQSQKISDCFRIPSSDTTLRDRIILQSKVGIRVPNGAYLSGEPGRYDFSRTHMVRSTEAILQRPSVNETGF